MLYLPGAGTIQLRLRQPQPFVVSETSLGSAPVKLVTVAKGKANYM